MINWNSTIGLSLITLVSMFVLIFISLSLIQPLCVMNIDNDNKLYISYTKVTIYSLLAANVFAIIIFLFYPNNGEKYTPFNPMQPY